MLDISNNTRLWLFDKGIQLFRTPKLFTFNAYPTLSLVLVRFESGSKNLDAFNVLSLAVLLRTTGSVDPRLVL